jgi:hypothetical protein
MPYLNRDVIRRWLEEHNWSIKRLAEECSTLGEDTFPVGTLRNAVNGIDPMRPGRIRVICKVTAKYGDGISCEQLTLDGSTPLRYSDRNNSNTNLDNI